MKKHIDLELKEIDRLYISIILPSTCGRIHRVRAQAETKFSSENGIHLHQSEAGDGELAKRVCPVKRGVASEGAGRDVVPLVRYKQTGLRLRYTEVRYCVQCTYI